MKKIILLTLTLILLSLVVFAKGNQKNKDQQNLQRRNEQIVRRLQNLSRAYDKADKKEVKEELSKNIDMEYDRWYAENTTSLFVVETRKVISEQEQEQIKEKLIQPGESLMALYGELQQEEKFQAIEQLESTQIKDQEQLKQEMLAEIKAGKIPELMLETVSPQFAQQIRQRAEVKANKQNEKQKEKQKSKGLKLFKK